MNYQQIKKLDEDSLKQLVEGSGPVDECICNILSPPEEEKKSLGSSFKKGIASIIPGRKRRSPAQKEGAYVAQRGGIPGNYSGDNFDLPENVGQGARGNVAGSGKGNVGKGGRGNVAQGGKGGVYTTKEVVKRSKPCGKCGCDKDDLVLNHSFANIRITTPDVSSFCPCPTQDCFPDKQKLLNNIEVMIEHATIDLNNDTPDPGLPETELQKEREPDTSELTQHSIKEPEPLVKSLVDAQYNIDETHELN